MSTERLELRRQLLAIGLGRTAFINGVVVQRVAKVQDGGHVDRYFVSANVDAVSEHDALEALLKAAKS